MYSENDQDDNHRYLGEIGIQSNLNPYAPFTSKMDWEIARWAKLRGPSSIAFTELMSIEGVSQTLKLVTVAIDIYHQVIRLLKIWVFPTRIQQKSTGSLIRAYLVDPRSNNMRL